MSQIGALLQGGILGGARAYEDAARLHLAQEAARRDAAFDPVRMQSFQAELEERRARAERMRMRDASTKQIFQFIQGQQGRMPQPGQMGPMQPVPNPFEALPPEVLTTADPGAVEMAMGLYENAGAASRNLQEVYNQIEGAKQQGALKYLDGKVVRAGLQAGLIREDEVADNVDWKKMNPTREDDEREALLDLASITRQPDGSLAVDAQKRVELASLETPRLRARVQIEEMNRKLQAQQQEQAAEQARLQSQAKSLGIDPGLAGIMTGAQLGEIAQRRAMPAASGSNTARNNGIAESIESRARAVESEMVKNPSPELQRQAQLLRAAETAARAGDVLPDGGVVLFRGQDVGGGFAKVMQPTGEIISVDASLVQQSMRAGGGAVSQSSADLDAAAIRAFTQRFGVPPDPSNPQHVDAFAEIEAQLQGQR